LHLSRLSVLVPDHGRVLPRSDDAISTVRHFGSDFGGQLALDLLVVVIALALAFRVRRRQDWFGLNPAASCLVLGSLLVIAITTLTKRSDARSSGHLQLIPLHTLRTALHQPADLLIYIGGNVALFIPLGFFLYLARRRWLLAGTVLCTMVSIGVEILQIPIWSRSTDVDDVLTNAAGGFIGALLAAATVQVIRSGRLGGRDGAPGRWFASVVTPAPEPDHGDSYPTNVETRPMPVVAVGSTIAPISSIPYLNGGAAQTPQRSGAPQRASAPQRAGTDRVRSAPGPTNW
jgi:hypothetical protein